MTARAKFHHGDLVDALVAAASRHIAEQRSADFSLRQVAEAVGVSHTAAYRHFRSKRDLIAELATRGFRGLRQALLAAAPPGADMVAAMRACARAYVAHGLAHPGAYRIMFHGDLCQDYDRPDLAEAAAAAFAVLQDGIAAGQAAGALRRDQPACTLAAAIWAALHGHTLLLLDGQISETGDPAAVPAGLDALLAVLLGGLAQPG